MALATPRVFSGIQPSGELHIGNFLGAVQAWVEIQHRYESYFCVVDYHAITVPYVQRNFAAARTRWRFRCLPRVSTPAWPRCSFNQRCRNIPSWRGFSTRLRPLASWNGRHSSRTRRSGRRALPPGCSTIPVLQAADILLYRADSVPVGEDQVQHLELTREIARRWNARFAAGCRRSFPEPKALLTPTRRIMGLDGQAKMSKSLGNTVGLLESPDEIWAKLRPGGDRSEARAAHGSRDAGSLQHLPPAQGVQSAGAPWSWWREQCRSAGWGCLDCKKVLFEGMERTLGPMRARAADIRSRPGHVEEVLGRWSVDGAAGRARHPARGQGDHGASR